MSFAHKVVLWVMQGRDYLLRLIKGKIFFFTRYCFVVKPTSVQQILPPGNFFFNDILRVAIRTNACELTE